MESFFWIDILLNFFQEYKDTKTHENISDLRKIAFHYVFRSTFVLDFLAVFPFYIIFGGNSILTKLFRLVRLPRLVRMLDNFKFIKLVVTASIITYFFGCIWYLLSDITESFDDEMPFFRDERFVRRGYFER